MQTRTNLSLQNQLAAALDWWRDAGVDYDLGDIPEAMLAKPDTRPEAPVSHPAASTRKSEAVGNALPPQVGGKREQWPDTLTDFAHWWLTEPSLDAGGMAPRVPPRGTAKAPLMVIVPMPEANDTERLLGNRQGELVGNMMRAMGLTDDTTYLASALPRHAPHTDWSHLKTSGMGEVLLHHIALVQPGRVLVLGRDICDLLGLDRKQGAKTIDADSGTIQILASFAPEGLLENTRLRSDLWRRWLDWTGNE